MQRLDWQLVPPLRPNGQEAGRLKTLLTGHRRQGALKALDGRGARRMARLREAIDFGRLSICEAVEAPTRSDAPGWRAEAIVAHAQSLDTEPLEAFLDERRIEPDCERCPYAAPYSIFPMEPCEFAAGGLVDIVVEPALRAALVHVKTPSDMRQLARDLEAALDNARVEPSAVVNTSNYIEKAVLFLRFWAEMGMSIEAVDGSAPLGEPLDTSAGEWSGQASGDRKTLH